MFEAMLEQVRVRRPKAIIGVPERVYNLNPDVYMQKGVVPVIYAKGKNEWLRKMLTRFGAFLFRRTRPLYVEEIDLVLFSPGFRFSDQFGVPAEGFIENEYSWFASFCKKNRKLIFMPQAFGPFESEVNKSRVRKLLMLATHIYPREKTSYEHVLPLVPDFAEVTVAPDFTCLYKGEPYELSYPRGGYVVVVPNRQMLVKAPKGVASKYCDFMFRLVRMLRARGENVVLLNHEGGADIGLIEVLSGVLDNQAVIVNDVSGGACKNVISSAKLVITSRFHGLVSALAEGTPVLCTSWSHKYQELVSEMDCLHSCLELQSVDKAMHIVEDALSTPRKYTSSATARVSLKHKTVAMWNEILPPDHDNGEGVRNVNCRMFYISPTRWESFMWFARFPLRLFRCLWR